MVMYKLKAALTTKGIGMASNGAPTVASGDEERTTLEECWSSSKSFCPTIRLSAASKGN